MKCASVLSAVGCLLSAVFAQTSWWGTYGGSSDEYGTSAQQTSDGGYVVAGTTWSFGADSGDLYLIKTNARGDTLWTRRHDGPGFCEGLSGQQTTDGGYVIAGYVFCSNDGSQSVYLVKTNASGNTLWTRTYSLMGYECGLSVQQTADSGYIAVGYTEPYCGGKGDVWLLKTDARGVEVWGQTCGGSDFEEGNSVQQTGDGGYIVAGYTYSFGAGGDDLYLVKTDSEGDTLWTRIYGGTGNDDANSVQQTSDGGYIIVGCTRSFGAGGSDVYLIKTRASGDPLWTRTYGGASDDGGSCVRQTSDGGYIIAGATSSFGAGKADVYLLKTSAQGDTLWTRTFGGTDDDGGSSVRQTADGGYIIGGYTYSFGAGCEDVYLIKTDANGNVGVAEESPKPQVPGHEPAATVMTEASGVERLASGVVFDAMGRRVLNPRSGVFFVKEAQAQAQATSGKPSAVTKVVITR